MQTNEQQFDDFFKNQKKIEEEINLINKLMDEFEKAEDKSIQYFYDNKEKFEILIEYSKKYNLYNYLEFEYFYNYLSDSKILNKDIILPELKGFINDLQDFNFSLNLFVNTYIENIINYKMTVEYLPEEDLLLSVSDNSYQLGTIHLLHKLKFTEKELFELVGVKNFKGTLKNLMNSLYNDKISFFYFGITSGKLKGISDYKKYLFFKQLYFRYSRYTEDMGKKVNNILFDVESQLYSKEYLMHNDIQSLVSFGTKFYEILHQYPITGELKIVFRSMFSGFNVHYLPNGEVDLGQIEGLFKNAHNNKGEQEFINNLKGLIKDNIGMLYLSTYSKEIEEFKNKNDLTDEEYESFKEYRFAVLFLQGRIVLNIRKKLGKTLLEKLKKDAYFSILDSYGVDIISIYGTVGNFSKGNVLMLKNKLKEIDSSGYSNLFISDLKNITSGVNMVKD